MSDEQPGIGSEQPLLRVTRREKEILGLIAQGLTDQEIAERLWVSIHTVHTHVAHLREKFQVPNRVVLMREAQRLGYVPAIPEKSLFVAIGEEEHLGYTPDQEVALKPSPEQAGGKASADEEGETEMLNPKLRFWYLTALLALDAQHGTAAAIVAKSERIPGAPAKRAATHANDSAAGMMARRVWARAPGGNARGTPSPDGRYLSMVDWDTGDVAVRDLTTGKNRRLTHKGSWSASGEFAWDSAISPDGKQVAYAWFIQDGLCDLRLIGWDGSRPRVLYRNEQVGWMTAVQWAPDGKQILVVLHRDKAASQLALISVADGSARVLKTFERELPRRMSFSPDGRIIAYDLTAQANAPERDIFLLAIDGSRDTPLVQHPADDFVIGWAPDGKRLLFASDRTGSPAIWLVHVADGKAQGSPELVKQEMGAILPLGLTPDGSLFYLLEVGIRDVYIASQDPATGQLQAPAQPVDPRRVGARSVPAWSPDGHYLAYVSRGGSTPSTGTCTVSIRTVASGKTRELALQLDSIKEMGWSAGGRSLLAVGQDGQGRSGAFRIDAQTGTITFFPDPGGFGRGVAWGPDGRTLVYTHGDADPRVWVITLRDLETGREQELYRAPGSGNPKLTLSPDGQQLAFWWREPGTGSWALKVMPATGGKPRELLRDSSNALPALTTIAFGWMPDGRHLLSSSGNGLWRIPVAGGAAQRSGLTMDGLRHLSIHPDGGRIAFAAGEPENEVWVLVQDQATFSGRDR